MDDSFLTGTAWLRDQLLGYAGTMISYARGTSSLRLTATIGQTTFPREDHHGQSIDIKVRDYLIDAADLRLDGILVAPEPGDRIVEDNPGGSTSAYEVMPLGDEKCWRWSDRHRQIIRVHAKYVEDSG